MKAKDLIKALKNFPPDLKVYNYCDHGQSPELAQSPSIIYYTGDIDEGYSHDKDDAEEYGYKHKAILL